MIYEQQRRFEESKLKFEESLVILESIHGNKRNEK